MILRILAPALAVIFAAESVVACAFHGYTPQPTVVDRMLASDHIVLARPAQDNPFQFAAIEAIEGGTELVEIPFLVDSATRRKMALDDGASVLFARDGAYGPWIRLATIDASFAPVLDEITRRLASWELGNDPDRFGYFASLLNHPDPIIHRLALRELDQAAYSVLRDLQFDVDVARLLDWLNDPAEANLKPIRVLLLGLVDDEAVKDILVRGVRGTTQVGGPMLGAYATAMIEAHGADGVDWIADQFLADSTIPSENRELLVEAMAIHADAGTPEVRDAVDTAISSALSTDVAIAAGIARQFGLRADWSFEEALADVLGRRALNSPADIIAVSQYVAFAREND